MEYGFSKTVDLSFEKAIIKVTDELKKEGFGILTSIDVQDTLKKKINVDFKKYVILGACNPVLAHKALSAEEQLGLLLPCNVVVSEAEDKTIKVSFFDPEVMSKLLENPVIVAVAAEVKQKLLKVLEHI
ncbi:MAG: DUF302 domain-containing protein [Bacteroidota bacterium]|nr:DUF302 domain-containing protein [Bacteroidota bacterium]